MGRAPFIGMFLSVGQDRNLSTLFYKPVCSDQRYFDAVTKIKKGVRPKTITFNSIEGLEDLVRMLTRFW